MRDLFKSFLQNPIIQNTLRWVSDKTAPIRAVWTRVTAPIVTFLAPVTRAWAKLWAPFWVRWAQFRQKRPLAGSVLAWIGWLIKWGVYTLLFLTLGVWIGLFGRLPSMKELKEVETANSTEIYTVDSVMIGKYFIENRTAISIDNISPYIVQALIATEDRRFLDHSGIDLQSWFRVGFGMLAGKESSGGGSTLSQQLAKNLYPRRKYWIPGISLVINKLRENFISIKLENVYNKQELLNLYLNTVPFGGDVFGIQVASKQYFNKKPRDLTVDQASTLVGMLKGTTLYNPVRNPENAKKRRNVVLYQMVRNGHLSDADFKELSKKPVGAKRYSVDSNNDGPGTYFREYLRTEVMPKLLKNYQKEDGTNYNLYTDGLKIYTTLHSKMQQYAEEAIQKHMSDLQKQFNQHWKNYKQDKPWGDDKWIDEQIKRSNRWESLKEAGKTPEEVLKNFETPVKMTIFSWKNGGGDVDTTMTPIDSVRYYFCMLNCGFMAMDHRNGFIRAWAGGTNFKYFKFDHILSKRQVGSTFKPIVYSAALQEGVAPCDYFPNEIKKIVDWEPHNSDESYGGFYSMSGALTKSVNVVAAQLIEKVGIQKTIDLAEKMGITSRLPREYGISLGAADITLYDMIKVYGTMANAGMRPEPVTVLKVEDRNGKVLYDYKKEMALNPALGPHVQALTEDQASIMTEMLQNVINYGTGSRLRRGFGITGDFAGKTGTTQNQSDGWFICYNPQLVTGAWVGAPSPAVRFRSMVLGQGSAMALPIVAWFWHKIANDRKLGKLVTEKFPDPKPEVSSELGCYPWIGINPDSFHTLMQQDSSFRDSIILIYTKKPDKTTENEPSEAPVDPAAKKEEEPVDGKKQGLFKKIFGHRREEEKEKDKKGI
jgi:penicillin-binding protein 1A